MPNLHWIAITSRFTGIIQSKINWFEIDTSHTLQKLNSTETLKEKCVIYGLVKKKTETWICMYLTSYDMLLQKKKISDMYNC
jgi:hypothetical protein